MQRGTYLTNCLFRIDVIGVKIQQSIDCAYLARSVTVEKNLRRALPSRRPRDKFPERALAKRVY